MGAAAVSAASLGLRTRLRLAPALDVWTDDVRAVWFVSPPGFDRDDGDDAPALAQAFVRAAPAVEVASRVAAAAGMSASAVLWRVERWHARGWLVDDGADDGVEGGPSGECLLAVRASPYGHGLRTLGFEASVEAELVGALPAFADGVVRVLARSYLDPRLPALLEALAAGGRSVFLARPVGADLWVGPRLGPHQAELRGRFLERLRLTHAATTAIAAEARCVARSRPQVGTAGWFAFAEAMALSGRWRSHLGAAPAGGGAVQRHRLPEAVRRPPEGAALRVFDGGYRVATPESVVRRMRPLVSPVTGIVGVERACRTVLPGLHLAVAAHALAPRVDALADLDGHLHWAAGKGTTRAQARAGALAEAAERHSGIFRAGDAHVVARVADLARALSPDRLQGFSAAQYAARATTNAAEVRGAGYVPEPFNPDVPLAWSPARSLVSGATVHVPTAWAYYASPDAAGGRVCVSDSNGIAAGTTRDEALLQALLELVERDAVAVWWYNRVARPALDLAAVDHPYRRVVEEAAARLGREVWALDLTHDLGLPVVAAISRRCTERVGGPEHLLFGFGAHLDPSVALLRALSELIQVFPHDEFLPGLPTDVPPLPSWGPSARRWLGEATVAENPFLRPQASVPASRIRGGAPPDTLASAIETVLGRICSAVPEVLVLDQTRPDVPLCVVRAIAPGLRHFWRRLAPGRLYDVPVSLGWLGSPTAEADLHHVALFA